MIWYESLRDSQTRPTSSFTSFAKVTVRQAGTIYGPTSAESNAVKAGWEAVKVPH